MTGEIEKIIEEKLKYDEGDVPVAVWAALLVLAKEIDKLLYHNHSISIEGCTKYTRGPE